MVSTSKIKILIAIIAHNEAGSIEQVIQGTEKLNFGEDSEYRVVVFNDASTDETLKITKKNNVEVVSHVFQSGNGMYVIPTYLQFAYEANVDIVIQIDGDNQHKSEYIPAICKKLFSTNSNIVVGSRYLEKKKFKGIFSSISKFDRILGNYIISFALKRFVGLPISDPTSGMRAYDKKAIIAIGGKSKHYKFDEKVVLMQLQYVLNIHPNHDFKIFNSRRTPQSLNAQIEVGLKNFNNARFIDINQPNDVSFDASLNESSLKFVTPDSANLVFESLSTHGKTYLIQIESPSYRRWFGSKKIRSTMNELVISKQVGVVSLLAKKNKLNISKIENPHPILEPLAEVEKVSFAIKKYFRD